MQFLTDRANIFYISAREIASNGLGIACEQIGKAILRRLGTHTFIFIEEPPFRWEDDVPRQLNKLRSNLETSRREFVIHDLIIPSDVYQKMSRRNTITDDTEEDEEYPEDVEADMSDNSDGDVEDYIDRMAERFPNGDDPMMKHVDERGLISDVQDITEE